MTGSTAESAADLSRSGSGSYGLVEFVRGREPEQFLADADALKRWLGELR